MKRPLSHIKFAFPALVISLFLGACGPTSSNKKHTRSKRTTTTNKPLIGSGKVVGLDYFFNNEYRKNGEGKEVRYHYIWEDTANTGYSDAGNMIKT